MPTKHRPTAYLNIPLLFVYLFCSFPGCYSKKASVTSEQPQSPKPPKTVTGQMQAHPGGLVEEVEVKVHAVPVDLPLLAADLAPIRDDDLVLGIVADGEAVAYPIRYLAMYEVVDSKVGKTPLAPTW